MKMKFCNLFFLALMMAGGGCFADPSNATTDDKIDLVNEEGQKIADIDKNGILRFGEGQNKKEIPITFKGRRITVERTNRKVNGFDFIRLVDMNGGIRRNIYLLKSAFSRIIGRYKNEERLEGKKSVEGDSLSTLFSLGMNARDNISTFIGAGYEMEIDYFDTVDKDKKEIVTIGDKVLVFYVMRLAIDIMDSLYIQPCDKDEKDENKKNDSELYFKMLRNKFILAKLYGFSNEQIIIDPNINSKDNHYNAKPSSISYEMFLDQMYNQYKHRLKQDASNNPKESKN